MITRMKKNYDQKLSRRALMLGGIKGVLAMSLVARLYYLQIEEGRQYQKLSDRNKYDFRIIPPSRGRIKDAKGRLLAGNTEAYELSVTPQYIDDIEMTIKQLSSLIDLTPQEIQNFIDDFEKSPTFLPIPIRTDLTQRELSRIAIRSPELPGVNFERVEKRIYPQGVLGGI